jgi:predicted kinase
VELVVLCGLQASGKSTFRRARLPGHLVVSKDLMARKGKDARQRRQLVAALGAGYDVVVDNTNPTKEERTAIIEIGKTVDAHIVGYYFESAMADCLRRNAERQPSDVVPEVGLRSTRARLTPPSPIEGYNELWYVRIGSLDFEVEPWAPELGANGQR